jgi:hypothetical protein
MYADQGKCPEVKSCTANSPFDDHIWTKSTYSISSHHSLFMAMDTERLAPGAPLGIGLDMDIAALCSHPLAKLRLASTGASGQEYKRHQPKPKTPSRPPDRGGADALSAA